MRAVTSKSAPAFHESAQAVALPSAAVSAMVLAEGDAKEILRCNGIRVPRGHTVDDLTLVPTDLVGPLVLKAVSPTLVHKSEAGGVRVGLSHSDLVQAGEEMRASLLSAGHDLTGYLVEEQVTSGQELVLGAVRTSGVGWVVMIGLGGIFVETFADVSFGVAPLGRVDIRDMLIRLRGYSLLAGQRGQQSVDVDAFIQLVLRIAGPDGLLASLPESITEIDLNPVIVSTDAAVAVDARFVSGDVVPGPRPPRVRQADFTSLFEPRTIAVLGAKSSGTNGANIFIRNLVDGGFAGRIVPVHPEATSIEGLPAVASLAQVDGEIDYAYVVLPSARVADALALGEGRVRFAQVVASGFSETEDGVELESELVARMARLGTRVIGPNCLGTHSPKARLSFIPNAPFEVGNVAIVSQSGGLSVDILRAGASRGVNFHNLVSIGNGADVTAAELLADHLANPDVKVVGLYLESLSEAAAVLDVLRAADGTTPIILLAGGRSRDGSRAAMSHTGALSANHRLWPAIAHQGGAILVDSVQELIDVLLAFDAADPDVATSGSDVVLFGNGGGASVLAADALERRGLFTPRLSSETVGRLEALGLPPGNGLLNPIDVPAPSLVVNDGATAEHILGTVLEVSTAAVVISHLNVGIIQRNYRASHGDVTGRIIEAIGRARDGARHRCNHLLVVKGDGSPEIEEQARAYAKQARAIGLAAYPSVDSAAVAASALVRHQLWRAGRGAEEGSASDNRTESAR